MGWTGLPGPLFPWLFTGADLFYLCPDSPTPTPRGQPEGRGQGRGRQALFFLAGKHGLIERGQASIVPGLQWAPGPDGLVPGASVLPLV